jgi:hypothetical protein
MFIKKIAELFHIKSKTGELILGAALTGLLVFLTLSLISILENSHP